VPEQFEEIITYDQNLKLQAVLGRVRHAIHLLTIQIEGENGGLTP
jgi:hypothetical protein